jgi:ureidoacrylate peracid hydrolase
VTPGIAPIDRHLTRILSPWQAALLVVDVQNDFCHQEGLFGKYRMDMTGVQTAAKQIAALLPVARQSSVPIIFIVMEHDAGTNSPVWVIDIPLRVLMRVSPGHGVRRCMRLLQRKVNRS